VERRGRMGPDAIGPGDSGSEAVRLRGGEGGGARAPGPDPGHPLRAWIGVVDRGTRDGAFAFQVGPAGREMRIGFDTPIGCLFK
jgi:hypothetical protein